MNIGARAGYGAALVTEESSLPVTLLKTRSSVYLNSILKIGILPYDKVLVAIPDINNLLIVLWALLKGKIICVLVEQAGDDESIMKIARLEQARFVIRERELSPDGNGETLVFEPVAVSDPVSNRHEHPDPIHYIFYERAVEVPYPETVRDSSLQNFFDQLDKALEPEENSCLMLSRGLSLSRLVKELIWASSRGVPVVLAMMNNRNDFSPYILSDQLRLDFGLFHFGSYAGSSGPDKYQLLFDTVQFADTKGFSCVWTPERHFNEFGGLFPNPSVLSAAIAVKTSRVQIRSGSLVSPLHHAVRIAEDWSLIDNLSGGRVAVSFASGWQCDDFIFSPGDYPQRHAIMLEQIQQVRRLWRGEKIRYKNGLDKEIEVSIFPRPVQQELPVWITVSGRKETFIDAGRIGANILTHLLWQDTDELIEKIALYRQSLKDSGFDPRSGKVSVMVHTYLGQNNETVKDKVRGPLKNYIRTSTQLIQSMVKSNTASTHSKDVGGRYGGLDDQIPSHLLDELLEIAFNRFFEEAALLGTIDKAKMLLKKLKGYDVDEIAALIDFGLGREDIMEGLTYLDELRTSCDSHTLSRHPVSFVHCSQEELENAHPGSSLMRLLESQTTILAETGLPEKIPPSLSGKVKVIGDRDTIAPLNDPRSMFTSALSVEF